ncbi:MAG: arginine--tRNA ligase [Pelagibacterales bacterium]|nr:arginine--tRNA ligase [Pelagibacterales bacterium]PPR16458.1 MAG: Arginine--tRNA ligase [Alphaproteobacteria bacterium MarineAlpha9_Bin3]
MNIFEYVKTILLDIAKSRGVEDDILLHKITAEPPKEDIHGDVSTNIALLCSKKLNSNPRQLAESFKELLVKNTYIDNVQIAGPGFINIFLNKNIFYECCKNVLNIKNEYGRSNYGKSEKVNIEYVSANPTGPMHIGHARGAVFGDSLANLLQYVGYNVTREYYINDAGQQIINLAKSVYIRYIEILTKKEAVFDDDLYPGEYLIAVAKEIIDIYGDRFLSCDEQNWIKVFKEFSTNAMMNIIKEDLSLINIYHDNFVSEEHIKSIGLIDKVVKLLNKNGSIYEGVLDPPKGQKNENWESRPQLLFKSTLFGDDLDRPLKKADNTWTYFAADSAYHYDKFKRNYTSLINVWGADHGGYIKRIEGIIKSISNSKLKFDVKLCQLVNLNKDGKPVKMSKRAGNFISMKSVIDSVGADVLRFIMLTRKNDAPLDFDLAKVKEQSKDNPVFYVQYANVRINSLYKKAQNHGINLNDELINVNFDLLNNSSEINIIKLIAKWPRQVEAAAKANEPHRITFYLNDLASAFHSSWSLGNEDPSLRYIIDNNMDLSKARLALAKIVKIIMASGLSIIGVEPVDKLS